MESHIVAYNEGANQPFQRIDQAQLLTDHQWPTQAEINPLFEEYVEMNTVPRCDMARYKSITMKETQDGRDAWSTLCKARSLFRIPETIPCDRTFTRDNEEAYYIDAMDAWLKGLPEDITVQDIPFVKRSLHHRLMYAFSRRTGYFSELFERRRTGLWLAFDAHENKYYGDVELHERHPRIEPWLQEIDQPPALPVPLPFVAFYYHTELQEAQRQRDHGLPLSERQRRLLFCLQHEYYVLFLAMWWSEAFYAGRQFVLPWKTIDALNAHCGNLALIGIKPVQVIIEFMKTASTRPSSVHVWLGFRQNWMEESTFVWAKKGSGEHDPRQTPVRSTIWADKSCRRITMTAYSAKVYRRNTALDKKLGDPDLDKIPGLLDLVYKQNWNIHGDMRVGDLLEKMLQLYSATRGVVDTLVKQGIGANHSEPRSRNDRCFPQKRPYDDRYDADQHDEHRPRIGYYDDDHYREDRYRDNHYRDNHYRDNRYHEHRYQEEGYRQEDRFRSQMRTPPRQSHYDNSQRREDDHYATGDQAANDTAPPQSPNYTPARVIDITENCVNTNREDDVAGQSTSQQVVPFASETPPDPAVANSSVRTECREPGERVQSPALMPGGWGHKLFAAARKDIPKQRAHGEPTTFTPATPFLKIASSSAEVCPDNPNEEPVQATASETNDGSVGPDTLSNTEYTKIGCGNVSWNITGNVGNKRGREELEDEQAEEAGRKVARVDKGSTELDAVERLQREEQDPVLRQLYDRHPPLTARHIAATIRKRDGNSDNAVTDKDCSSSDA